MNGDASAFDLVTAGSLDEALRYVSEGRRPIAGGTDLMVLFEAGLLSHRRLVSIRDLPVLHDITANDNHVDIGACVSYSEIRKHPVLQREFGLLCQAASWTGGIANQNRGTLGGNIVNASPAADSPPALLVYDAEVELVSLRGPRWLKYESFHTGYKIMRLEHDELLTRIRIPRVSGDWIGYGRKVGMRKAQAISKLAVAAIARMDGYCIGQVRIAMASLAPFPLRCRHTEQVLTGGALSRETRLHAQRVLLSELSPIDDIRSTREYRYRVAANLLDEFLEKLSVPDELARWNGLPPHLAQEQIAKCCGSQRWAAAMAAGRPFTGAAQLFAFADEMWLGLDEEDRLQAFLSHPRIGDATLASQSWTASEQSGMDAADASLRQSMAAANREYESRFGFIYIVCATGKSAAQMLDLLHRRLGHDRDTELQEASEQQRQIMQLRLRKWLA